MRKDETGGWEGRWERGGEERKIGERRKGRCEMGEGKKERGSGERRER